MHYTLNITLTIRYDALDLKVLPPPRPQPWPSPLERHLVAITRDLFKLVHLRTPLLRSDICWCPLMQVRLPSGRCEPYWNVFLLLTLFTCFYIVSGEVQREGVRGETGDRRLQTGGSER